MSPEAEKEGNKLYFQVVGTFHICSECGRNEQPSCMPVLFCVGIDP